MDNQTYIYIVLIGIGIIIISLLLPRLRRNQNQPSSVQSQKEMEETMEVFFMELEKENGKLLVSIAKMKQEHEQAIGHLTRRLELIETNLQEEQQDWRKFVIQRMDEQERNELSKQAEQPSTTVAEPAPIQTAAETEAADSSPVHQEDLSIRERYGDIFHMYDQGKSIEFIARRKGLNKGEISLIIQLAAQEEQKLEQN